MTRTPDLELTEDLRALAARYLYLTAERVEIDTELSDVKAKLRSTIAVGQRATIDGTPVLTVTPNRRFDPVFAAGNLPPALVALCTAPTFDPKLAKTKLPAEMYEACMRPVGEPILRSL